MGAQRHEGAFDGGDANGQEEITIRGQASFSLGSEGGFFAGNLEFEIERFFIVGTGDAESGRAVAAVGDGNSGFIKTLEPGSAQAAREKLTNGKFIEGVDGNRSAAQAVAVGIIGRGDNDGKMVRTGMAGGQAGWADRNIDAGTPAF